MTVEQVFHFVRINNRFESKILVQQNEVQANGKGYLGMTSFMMTMKKGEPIDLMIKGSDAEEAADTIKDYLKSLRSRKKQEDLGYYEQTALDQMMVVLIDSDGNIDDPRARCVEKAFMKEAK